LSVFACKLAKGGSSMYFKDKFDCRSCGYDFERESEVSDCRKCHDSYCDRCVDNEGNCVSCSD